jgi:hypothetical protein
MRRQRAAAQRRHAFFQSVQRQNEINAVEDLLADLDLGSESSEPQQDPSLRDWSARQSKFLTDLNAAADLPAPAHRTPTLRH